MSNARTLANTINSSSQIVVPSGGVNFGTGTDGTGTVTGGVLDDYEEGTWTPVFGGVNFSGNYVKVGSLVYFFILIDAAASGSIIGGLPFTPSSDYNSVVNHGRSRYVDYRDNNGVPCVVYVSSGNNEIYFRTNSIGGDDSGFTVTTSDNRAIYTIAGVYKTDS